MLWCCFTERQLKLVDPYSHCMSQKQPRFAQKPHGHAVISSMFPDNSMGPVERLHPMWFRRLTAREWSSSPARLGKESQTWHSDIILSIVVAERANALLMAFWTLAFEAQWSLFFLALSKAGAESNPEDTRDLLGRSQQSCLCLDVECTSAFISLSPGEAHRPVVLVCVALSANGP